MSIAFQLDENLAPAAAVIGRRLGVDVLAAAKTAAAAFRMPSSFDVQVRTVE